MAYTKEQREILKDADFQLDYEKRRQEADRLAVVKRELYARANKAEYENMYFYLEARKIEAEYLKQVALDKEKAQEMDELARNGLVQGENEVLQEELEEVEFN